MNLDKIHDNFNSIIDCKLGKTISKVPDGYIGKKVRLISAHFVNLKYFQLGLVTTYRGSSNVR